MPPGGCTSRGIPADRSVCLADMLRLFASSTPGAANSTQLPTCSASGLRGAGGAGGMDMATLIDAPNLQVYCTETYAVTKPNASAVDDALYCAYWQARCNQVREVFDAQPLPGCTTLLN